MANNTCDILSIGEVLWDALPEGLFLGGAPFNVACHVHMLGERVGFVSRVGDDVLGQEVLHRMRERGMVTELMQIDTELATGFVEVALDARGIPSYHIREPAAWDAIIATESFEAYLDQARLVVFGTLAQRHDSTRQTIQSLKKSNALKVLDINLRPPHINQEVVESSLRLADVLKLNDEELLQISTWWGLGARPMKSLAEAIAARFDLRAICITRGAFGAALWKNGEWLEHPGYKVTVRDTVGAGDAFLSGLLQRFLADAPAEEMLAFACRMGAFVAAQTGATPHYTPTEVEAYLFASGD